MISPLRVGTRSSRLALWQAAFVADNLRSQFPARSVDVVEIQTAGDQLRDAPLSRIGGDGVFTKELQRSLLDGSIDVAVHSLKDLPTLPVEGLCLAAVPMRGPVGDVYISRQHHRFDDLPDGATLATGSLRRQAQALHRRPDLHVIGLRGNVETRLRKLAEENFAGLILAQAGLERLGLREVVSEILSPEWMLPAVGQGALGLECRADDRETQRLLQTLDHVPTRLAVQSERAFLRTLGGGCLVPVGAMTTFTGSSLSLRGVVLSIDGLRRLEASVIGPSAAAESLGNELAEELLAQGAQEILNFARMTPS
jgi:hydroxymethylbilane synthase